MRIATWNVNSLRLRVPQGLEWLARAPGKVLAMPETKLSDPDPLQRLSYRRGAPPCRTPSDPAPVVLELELPRED